MIPEYKTILYATDLTPNAAFALRHAIGIARKYDAKVKVLHVLAEVDASVVNYVATVMGEDRLADFELQHHKEVANEIKTRIESFASAELNSDSKDLDRIVGIVARHGNPIAEILEEADECGADLIVVGSHGKGALSYAFLGSVAEKLLRKSHRPVLVVPLEK